MEDSHTTDVGTNLKTSEHLRDATIAKWLENASKHLYETAEEYNELDQWLGGSRSDPTSKTYLNYILVDWYMFLSERECLPSTWDCPLPNCDVRDGTFGHIMIHLQHCQHLKDSTRQYICPGCQANIEMPGHTCGGCQGMDHGKKTHLDTSRSSPDHTPDENANDDYGEDQLSPDQKALLESEAYRWLVSVVQQTVRLDGINPNFMVGQRESIIRQLTSIASKEKYRLRALMSSERPPALYIARFGLSWDLLKFLREEYEGENPAGVVSQVVTLTGDGHSVQAATCRGYVEQVWPTTGSEFMDLVEDMITRTDQLCKCMLLVLCFNTLACD